MVEYLLEAKKFIEYARAAYSAEAPIRISTWQSGALTAPSRKLGTSPRRPSQKQPRSRTRHCALPARAPRR